MRVTCEENVRATVGCRAADTGQGACSAPSAFCLPASPSPVPPATCGGCPGSRGTGPARGGHLVQSIPGKGSQEVDGSPGDSCGSQWIPPGCCAACPQDRPVLLPPWRGHEEPTFRLARPPPPRQSTHVCLGRSPEGECSAARVPCPPEGTFLPLWPGGFGARIPGRAPSAVQHPSRHVTAQFPRARFPGLTRNCESSDVLCFRASRSTPMPRTQ